MYELASAEMAAVSGGDDGVAVGGGDYPSDPAGLWMVSIGQSTPGGFDPSANVGASTTVPNQVSAGTMT